MALSESNLLSLVIFLPLSVGVGLLLVQWLLQLFSGRTLTDQVWKVAGLGASIAGLALAFEVWARFDPTRGTMQMVEHAPWIAELGIHYYVGIDGISLLLVLLTAFLLPVILLASWNDITKRVKQYVFFMLALQSGMLGAFLSLNLFLFYVFWEVMLIPMYFVIGIWGGPRRIYATIKFFIYTMVFQPMWGTRSRSPASSLSGKRSTRPGMTPRPAVTPCSSLSSNSTCRPRQRPR